MSDDENTERRGTIEGVQASFGSGLITLLIKGPDGKVEVVRGDNGSTVRALMGMFGSDIVRAHTLMVDRIMGREVGYGVDDMSILTFLAE